MKRTSEEVVIDLRDRRGPEFQAIAYLPAGSTWISCGLFNKVSNITSGVVVSMEHVFYMNIIMLFTNNASCKESQSGVVVIDLRDRRGPEFQAIPYLPAGSTWISCGLSNNVSKMTSGVVNCMELAFRMRFVVVSVQYISLKMLSMAIPFTSVKE